MKSIIAAFCLLSLCTLQYCTGKPESKALSPTVKNTASAAAKDSLVLHGPIADAATIMARKEVPVLCYHHIRDFRPGEKESMKEYEVPVQSFKDQMKWLHDSGYHTITPNQYYAYLVTGAPLPSKPIMLTYDDTDEEQFSIGANEMNKYGFKGVYFIMTISIGRPRYMSKDQLKQLSDEGHVIAAHTWDHHRVTQYTDADWDKQLAQSKQLLEKITGRPVDYFAYPFGLWNEAAIPPLKKQGIKAAFQLSTKRDPEEPLYTIRRMIVHGLWNTGKLHRYMNGTFHLNS